jgi:NAD(P)-dependent dehydrogenase (short-subunit alcohol dehydrogenase family)
MTKPLALIVGAGSGLSASIARKLAADGVEVALAARRTEKLDSLAREIGARVYQCDASKMDAVERLFEQLDREKGDLDLVVYNASYRVRGPFIELDPIEVEKTLMVTCFGGFLVGQAAARRMLPKGRGTVIFTGASASVKGYAASAPFAMGKFGLRGLTQSMARELAPQGIHVAHVVIDGGIASSYSKTDEDRAADKFLDPDALAEAYLQLYRQHRSVWTWEIEVRPWTERF